MFMCVAMDKEHNIGSRKLAMVDDLRKEAGFELADVTSTPEQQYQYYTTTTTTATNAYTPQQGHPYPTQYPHQQYNSNAPCRRPGPYVAQPVHQPSAPQYSEHQYQSRQL